MVSETVLESPTGYSLVAELGAAGLTAFPSDNGGVRLSPTENITDAVRERMKPHKDVLRAYLDERAGVEATFPLSWQDAAASALPDACAAHIEARGFCYREPELLGGAKIIVAKNDCALDLWYMGAAVFYECELEGVAAMGMENAQRLHGDKARLFPAWQATGFWSGVSRERASTMARMGGMAASEALNLLGYLVGLGIAQERNEGGMVWRLVPALSRGRETDRRGQKGENE